MSSLEFIELTEFFGIYAPVMQHYLISGINATQNDEMYLHCNAKNKNKKQN